MKNLVVFASGSGSNFQAIIDSVNRGDIQAKIVGLITNNPKAGSIERAKKHGIPTTIISADNHEVFTQKIEDQLAAWQPDLIILAGFLRKIPDSIIQRFPDKIINIHPSLLPKYGGKGFYGLRVHRSVLDAHEQETGCTVHFVNKEYDKGAIIDQIKIPVLSDDTPESLAKRVLTEEHKLLPSVIAKLINS